MDDFRVDREVEAVTGGNRGDGLTDGLGKLVSGRHAAARIRGQRALAVWVGSPGSVDRTTVGPSVERAVGSDDRRPAPPVALVAQRIEHRPPEPVAQVRVLPGALPGALLPGTLPGALPGAQLVAGIRAVRSCLLYTSPSPRDRTRSRMPS